MKTMRNNLAQWIRQVACDHVTDGELLRRFTLEHDQAAFELLVHRYGT